MKFDLQSDDERWQLKGDTKTEGKGIKRTLLRLFKFAVPLSIGAAAMYYAYAPPTEPPPEQTETVTVTEDVVAAPTTTATTAEKKKETKSRPPTTRPAQTTTTTEKPAEIIEEIPEVTEDIRTDDTIYYGDECGDGC